MVRDWLGIAWGFKGIPQRSLSMKPHLLIPPPKHLLGIKHPNLWPYGGLLIQITSQELRLFPEGRCTKTKNAGSVWNLVNWALELCYWLVSLSELLTSTEPQFLNLWAGAHRPSLPGLQGSNAWSTWPRVQNRGLSYRLHSVGWLLAGVG